MRPSGSPEALERRRFKAMDLLEDGLQPIEVAKELKYARRSVAVGKLLSEIRALKPSRPNLLLAVLRNLINSPKKIWKNAFFKEQKRLASKQIFGHVPESLN